MSRVYLLRLNIQRVNLLPWTCPKSKFILSNISKVSLFHRICQEYIYSVENIQRINLLQWIYLERKFTPWDIHRVYKLRMEYNYSNVQLLSENILRGVLVPLLYQRVTLPGKFCVCTFKCNMHQSKTSTSSNSYGQPS